MMHRFTSSSCLYSRITPFLWIPIFQSNDDDLQEKGLCPAGICKVYFEIYDVQYVLW